MNSSNTLSQCAAKALAAKVGLLSLPDITELDKGAADELSLHPGTLELPGLHALPQVVAHALSHHRDWLLLDGLTTLDSTAAHKLATHRGGLSLRGLRTLDPEVAECLAPTPGDLRLDSVQELDERVATALAGHQHRLSLDGLATLSTNTLAALACHTGGLSLGGLTSLDSEQAAILANHRGRLWLDGLRTLSSSVAKILGRHEGGISLEGLVDAGDEAVAHLAPADRDRLRATSQESSDAKAQAVRFKAAGGESESLDVVIIGGGFAGIAMAIRLLENGRRDFAILEKASSLGGTWRDNTYPGCACDIPSRLYSFSFAPDTRWSRRYAPQSEILDYIERVAARHDINRWTRFNTVVESLEWDEHSRTWQLTAADGRRFTARAVISAVGGIHIPQVPELPGLDSFAGPAIHTASWQDDIELEGRHVAIIGTGASAIQVVPEIASKVERLLVYQRSAAWILPRGDRPISPLACWLDDHVPGLRTLRRQWIYWMNEARVIPFTMFPQLVRHPQRKAKAFMHKSGVNHRLLLKLIPSYALGCKRVLKSDDYYATVARSNVEVIAESIQRIGRWDITTADGVVRPVDAIILATGFKPFNLTDAVHVVGRDQQSLADVWQDGPQAYRGMAVAGFPNLFLLMGPNTGLGHNSILVMIEAQVNAIMHYLGWLERGELPAVEVTAEAQAEFNATLSDRMERTVWRSSPLDGSGGEVVPPCGSWYRHASGRNHVIWPGSASSYVAAVGKMDIAAFRRAEDFVTKPASLPMRRAA